MNYKTLKQDEMQEVIVSFYKGQETDLYVHNINKERYEEMLKTLPEGPFKTRVEKLLAETNERIEEVSAILAATEKQLPAQNEIDTVLASLELKEGVK
jgi:Tfp pilus assembly protein PilO